MSLRLLKIVVPSQDASTVLEKFLPDIDTSQRWEQKLNDGRTLIQLVIESQAAEEIVDRLESRFASTTSFRVLVLPIEAAIPRISSESASEKDSSESNQPDRVGREELYTDVSESARISRVFLAQIVLSTIVAAIGLIRNDVTVIIGAMVIAPLLGPNVALALATTLGDMELARDSLKSNAVGVLIALTMAFVAGSLLTIDTTTSSIDTRTRIGSGDIILALASGSAGVFAFTSGASSALVGVMVAVALLPPLVVFGLLLGAGAYQDAIGALLLVLTNVICVNLAGVVTFYLQGIRPRTWWEAKRAKRSMRLSVAIWTTLLVLLAILILLSPR